jgi:hypothetical protein
VLCRNRNDFRFFVKYFKESYEEVQKNNLLNDPSKYSLAHINCTSFFPELEIVMIPDISKNELENQAASNFTKMSIVCSGKDVKEKFVDDCQVCELPVNKYILIQCMSK